MTGTPRRQSRHTDSPREVAEGVYRLGTRWLNFYLVEEDGAVGDEADAAQPARRLASPDRGRRCPGHEPQCGPAWKSCGVVRRALDIARGTAEARGAPRLG
jgi:hypothetical protein